MSKSLAKGREAWDFARRRAGKALLAVLTPVAVFGMFSGSTEPVVGFLQGTSVEPYLRALHNGNSIFFNLSIGYLVSLFFWWLLVYWPERSRRLIIRNNLSRRYQDFKESTIQIILWAANESESSKRLCDHRAFRKFFDANGNRRWYAALNGLEENRRWIEDLLVELELFASEVAYVLNNINVQDDKVHSFFKRLNEIAYRFRHSSAYSDEQVKYLGNFIWGIHARWNIAEGQLTNDVIQDMIDSL
jgi:hypothetical protein